MAPKRALLFCHGNDDKSADVRKFIEDAGVILDVRDIGERPLTEDELMDLIGHLEITHFLNTFSSAYEKHGLDKRVPDRQEVIKLMAQDHTLIRCPIVRSSRLLTVGCDHAKIGEMLQINSNGQQQDAPMPTGNLAPVRRKPGRAAKASRR